MCWDVCTAMPDAFRRGENENEREQVITSFISEVGVKKEAAKRQTNAANALRQKLKNPSHLIFMKNSHVNHNRTVVSGSLFILFYSFALQLL